MTVVRSSNAIRPAVLLSCDLLITMWGRDCLRWPLKGFVVNEEKTNSPCEERETNFCAFA